MGDDDGDSAQEGTAVQLVEPLPWHGRPDGGPLGAPARPQAAVPRSLSNATTIPTREYFDDRLHLCRLLQV